MLILPATTHRRGQGVIRTGTRPGGQLIEVVPQRHLVIVVSTDHDITVAHESTVGPDDLQHLVDVIVPFIKRPSGS